jgi:hypothetical protein
MLFDVKGDTVSSFEMTSISCLPAWQITDQSARDGGGGIIFTQNACMRRLALDTLPNTARLQSDYSVVDILLRKAQQPPKSYGEPLDNTPKKNYAVFWQTFAENYPLFELHHVDWATVDRKFRPQVTSKTSQSRGERL